MNKDLHLKPITARHHQPESRDTPRTFLWPHTHTHHPTPRSGPTHNGSTSAPKQAPLEMHVVVSLQVILPSLSWTTFTDSEDIYSRL